jgi:hypothetical protein
VRTTLDIDEDVLLAIKEIAEVNHVSVGKVLSSLARKGLEKQPSKAKVRNGVPLLPPRSRNSPVLTLDAVKQLSEEG